MDEQNNSNIGSTSGATSDGQTEVQVDLAGSQAQPTLTNTDTSASLSAAASFAEQPMATPSTSEFAPTPSDVPNPDQQPPYESQAVDVPAYQTPTEAPDFSQTGTLDAPDLNPVANGSEVPTPQADLSMFSPPAVNDAGVQPSTLPVTGDSIAPPAVPTPVPHSNKLVVGLSVVAVVLLAVIAVIYVVM
jgi:hypothetical protein